MQPYLLKEKRHELWESDMRLSEKKYHSSVAKTTQSLRICCSSFPSWFISGLGNNVNAGITFEIWQSTIWYASWLVRWAKWLVKQVFDVPSTIFFTISFKILYKNVFNLFFYFFYKLTRINSFECPKSMRNYKKDNAWNIRRLVNESYVLANQRIIL